MAKEKAQRQCFVCQQLKAKDLLLRLCFVEQQVILDMQGKLGGRGLYLCRDAPCLDLALKEHGFAPYIEKTWTEEEQTQFKAYVQQSVEQQKREKLFHLLTLGFRASYLACGRMASSISIKKQKAFALLLAHDLAKTTKEEMFSLAKQHQVPVYFTLDKEQLGKLTKQEERACITIENEAFFQGVKAYLSEETKWPKKT